MKTGKRAGAFWLALLLLFSAGVPAYAEMEQAGVILESSLQTEAEEQEKGGELQGKTGEETEAGAETPAQVTDPEAEEAAAAQAETVPAVGEEEQEQSDTVTAEETAESEPADGGMTPAPQTVRTVPAANPAVTAADIYGDNRVFEILLLNCPAEKAQNVRVAVWSAQDGQDDLAWYEMTPEEGSFWRRVEIAAHRGTGKYYADIWSFGDSPGYVGGTTFTVTLFPGPSFSLAEEDAEAGTFTVQVTGLSAQSVESVRVPTWYAPDQSDIRWYTAEYGSDGAYRVQVNIASHGGYRGRYISHIYVNYKDGRSVCLGGLTADMTRPADRPVFTVGEVAAETDNTGAFTLTASGMEASLGIKELRIAVWTEKDSQDDLIWYTASKEADGSFTVKSSISAHNGEEGRYICHAYVTDSRGNEGFVGAVQMEIALPAPEFTIGEVTGTFDEQTGDFVLRVAGAESSLGISRMRIAVWTEKDSQDDLIWYTASKEADGSYVVKSSIASHNFEEGMYICHSYATDSRGNTGFTGAVKMDVRLAEGEYLLEDISPEGTTGVRYRAFVPAKPGLSGYALAVWSDAGGQDDLIWYDMTLQGSRTAAAEIPVKNHATAGQYYADAYARDSAGKHVFLKSFTFTVPGITAAEMEAAADEEGIISISVTGVESPSGLVNLRAAIWSETNGQDDLEWLNLTPGAEGAWQGTTRVSRHRYNTGKYLIHVYGLTGSGINAFAVKTELAVEYVGSFDTVSMQEAAAKLDEIGWDLRAAFDWASSLVYSDQPGLTEVVPAGVSHLDFYARHGFETGNGICYVYGAVFTCMARCLNYSAYYIEGAVMYRSGSYGPHGWCEIDIDGVTYVFDPEFQHSHPELNGYQFLYGTKNTWKYANAVRVE